MSASLSADSTVASGVFSAHTYDVVVIGAGAAGLSASLYLGRARRSVLTLTTATHRNDNALVSHNFLSRDGVSPSSIVADGLEQLGAYPGVTIAFGEVIGASRCDDGLWQISIANTDHTTYDSRKAGRIVGLEAVQGSTDGKTVMVRCYAVIAASGLRDVCPVGFPTFIRHWGRSILHCPYCHGLEHADETTIIVAPENTAFMGMMITHVPGWTHPSKITFIRHGVSLTEEHIAAVKHAGFTYVDSTIRSIVEDSAGQFMGFELEDGSHVLGQCAYWVQPRVQRCSFLADIGCKLHESGVLKGRVVTDGIGSTGIPGFFVAGDAGSTLAMEQVVTAAASGCQAAVGVNTELLKKGISGAKKPIALPS